MDKVGPQRLMDKVLKRQSEDTSWKTMLRKVRVPLLLPTPSTGSVRPPWMDQPSVAPTTVHTLETLTPSVMVFGGETWERTLVIEDAMRVGPHDGISALIRRAIRASWVSAK